MKVIYVSSLISKEKMNMIIQNSNQKPLQSIQKFHRLICEGLAENSIEVETISAIPMSRKISKKIIWFEKKEKVKGVKYNYIPFINIKILRQLFIFVFTIIYVMKYIIKERKEIVFICDILNTTISLTTTVLSKLFKVRCIAIVTDLPRDMKSNKKINEKLQSKYDGYILLTNAMNEIVNPKKKPYIVIEGIADIKEIRNNEKIEKYQEKVIMYAGGLYEKYGVKMLIEALSRIKDKNIRLHIYGSGELEQYIRDYPDNRIVYYGVVTNDVIVKEEKKVTLLINPRFTNEEYTKYSFPSKNIEYMASGTPVLTTKLPSMPDEYNKYVYLIENEDLEGYKKAIENVMKKSNNERDRLGNEARNFILKQKNNNIQCKKIITLIKKI